MQLESIAAFSEPFHQNFGAMAAFANRGRDLTVIEPEFELVHVGKGASVLALEPDQHIVSADLFGVAGQGAHAQGKRV